MSIPALATMSILSYTGRSAQPFRVKLDRALCTAPVGNAIGRLSARRREPTAHVQCIVVYRHNPYHVIDTRAQGQPGRSAPPCYGSAGSPPAVVKLPPQRIVVCCQAYTGPLTPTAPTMPIHSIAMLLMLIPGCCWSPPAYSALSYTARAHTPLLTPRLPTAPARSTRDLLANCPPAVVKSRLHTAYFEDGQGPHAAIDSAV